MGAGAIMMTALVLTGEIRARVVPVAAEFENCGQGLREGGDVKLRGVLVGTIGPIELVNEGGDCRVGLDLKPDDVELIPADAGAEIRAKTIFGEKWVEMVVPESSTAGTIQEGDVIPKDRTADPLEVETILNVALPLLDAVDPEYLAGALEALAEGFVGHEDAVITGIDRGIVALEAPRDNQDDLIEGISQLEESGEVLTDIDVDPLRTLANLDDLNLVTSSHSALINENL